MCSPKPRFWGGGDYEVCRVSSQTLFCAWGVYARTVCLYPFKIYLESCSAFYYMRGPISNMFRATRWGQPPRLVHMHATSFFLRAARWLTAGLCHHLTICQLSSSNSSATSDFFTLSNTLFLFTLLKFCKLPYMLSSGLENLFLERELLSNIFLESQCSFFLDLKGRVAKSGHPWIGGSFGNSVWCGGCGAGGAAMDKAEMDSLLIDMRIYETVPTHLLPSFWILVVKWEKERGVFLLEKTAWGETPFGFSRSKLHSQSLRSLGCREGLRGWAPSCGAEGGSSSYPKGWLALA